MLLVSFHSLKELVTDLTKGGIMTGPCWKASPLKTVLSIIKCPPLKLGFISEEAGNTHLAFVYTSHALRKRITLSRHENEWKVFQINFLSTHMILD